MSKLDLRFTAIFLFFFLCVMGAIQLIAGDGAKSIYSGIALTWIACVALFVTYKVLSWVRRTVQRII